MVVNNRLNAFCLSLQIRNGNSRITAGLKNTTLVKQPDLKFRHFIYRQWEMVMVEFWVTKIGEIRYIQEFQFGGGYEFMCSGTVTDL